MDETVRCGIIGFNRCRWLWVAKGGKYSAKGDDNLCIVENPGGFRFCCGANNVAKALAFD